MSYVIFSHRTKRFTAVASAVCVLAMLSGTAAAKAPEPSDEKGVPQYIASEFQIVKQMLAENAKKMEELSAQLAAVESQLQSDIEAAKSSIETDIAESTTAIRGDLDLLALDVADLLNDDIELTTEFCFDMGAAWDWAYTGNLQGGVGWDAVLKGEAVLELNMPGILPLPTPIPPFVTGAPIVPALNAGLGNTICLTVPLYSAESGPPLVADLDTASFDHLVGVIASPAQTLVPLLADVFGQIFPTPGVSMMMVSNSLAMFDTRSNDLTVAGLESGSVGVEKAGGNMSYLNADPAVHMAAAMSFEDMVIDSTLFSHIMQGDQIEKAIADPCTFATKLEGPSEEVVGAVCEFKKIVDPLKDPLCAIDFLNIIPGC